MRMIHFDSDNRVPRFLNASAISWALLMYFLGNLDQAGAYLGLAVVGVDILISFTGTVISVDGGSVRFRSGLRPASVLELRSGTLELTRTDASRDTFVLVHRLDRAEKIVQTLSRKEAEKLDRLFLSSLPYHTRAGRCGQMVDLKFHNSYILVAGAGPGRTEINCPVHPTVNFDAQR